MPTCRTPLTRTRDLFVRQSLGTLHRHTHEPLWRLLTLLDHPRPHAAALTAPIPPRYRNLAVSLSAGHDDVASLNLPPTQEEVLRTWIHVHGLFRRCQSPGSTLDVLVDPLLSALPSLPAHHQAPMLILGAAHFATWNLVLPLEQLTNEFLTLPHPIETPIYTTRRAAQQRVLTLCDGEQQQQKDVVKVDKEAKRVLTLNDAPTRPTSELYTNLYLRALALTPTYSTAYAQSIRRVIARLDALPKPFVRRTAASVSSLDGAILNLQNIVPKKDGQQVDELQLPYTLHPDTYTCLLLSTHNTLSTPGRVPHQSFLLSPPLATFLAARLLSEPGPGPTPPLTPTPTSTSSSSTPPKANALQIPNTSNIGSGPHTQSNSGSTNEETKANEKQGTSLMTQTHREALLRFWAKESKAAGARGVRGRENARELWLEIQSLSMKEEGVSVPSAPDAAHNRKMTLDEGAGVILKENDCKGTKKIMEGKKETKKEPDVKPDPTLRANTLYLGSQPSVRGVRELLGIFSSASSPSRSPSHHHSASSRHSPPPTTKAGPPTKPEKEANPTPQLRMKPALDAYDLTATLTSAANDASVDVAALRGVWGKLRVAYGRQGGPPSPSASPASSPGSTSTASTSSPTKSEEGNSTKSEGKNIQTDERVESKKDEGEKKGQGGKVPLAAHTAYLRGLYWRGAFDEARAWWEAEVWGKSVWAPAPPSASVSTSSNSTDIPRGAEGQAGGYVLDKKAVTIGVQILIRCGRAEEGLRLLERVAWKPGMSSLPSSTVHPPNPDPKPIFLTQISLLDILVSLKRASRPDVVFHLFDALPALYGFLPTPQMLEVVLQSARMAVVMDGRSLGAQVRGVVERARGMFSKGFGGSKSQKKSVRGCGSGSGMGEGGEEVTNGREQRERERVLEEVMDVARRKAYEGGRLWRGMRVEDAAREVFLQCLFGMEVGYRRSPLLDGNFDNTGKNTTAYTQNPTDPNYTKVGLANVRAPACSVRDDWDSDAGVVGLGVGLPELRLRMFEYKPGPEMYDWVPAPSPASSFTSSSPSPSPPSSSPSSFTTVDDDGRPTTATLVPRPLYPSLSLPNSAFLSYLSLLALTRRTPEAALTLAWMRELGVQPSESTLALGMVLWEEVSTEGPLVEVISNLGRKKNADRVEGRKREPSDEYERLVFWIEEWVGPERVPGIEVLRKWRSIVRDMREPGVRAALRRQVKEERAERRKGEAGREVRRSERRGGGGRT